MKVVTFNPQQEQVKKHKQDLLDILDNMKAMVENGTIDEFVAASVSKNGETQIHACVKDFVGGVGLFEIGKNIFLLQNLDGD